MSQHEVAFIEARGGWCVFLRDGMWARCVSEAFETRGLAERAAERRIIQVAQLFQQKEQPLMTAAAEPPIPSDWDNRLADIKRIFDEAQAPALQLLGELRAVHLRELEAIDRTLLRLADSARLTAENVESAAQSLARLVELIVESQSDEEEKPGTDLEGRPLLGDRDQTQSLDRPAPKG